MARIAPVGRVFRRGKQPTKIMKSTAICLSGALLAALPAFAEQSHIDPALPTYKAVSGVSGNLNSMGSDTLNNLMTLWAEGFKVKQHWSSLFCCKDLGLI
jgi:phosphate transport system substrate-binding protein